VKYFACPLQQGGIQLASTNEGRDRLRPVAVE